MKGGWRQRVTRLKRPLALPRGARKYPFTLVKPSSKHLPKRRPPSHRRPNNAPSVKPRTASWRNSASSTDISSKQTPREQNKLQKIARRPASVKCPQCGSDNASDLKFCPKDGTPLSPDARRVVEPRKRQAPLNVLFVTLGVLFLLGAIAVGMRHFHANGGTRDSSSGSARPDAPTARGVDTAGPECFCSYLCDPGR